MSDFGTDFAAAAEDLEAAFGDQVTYTRGAVTLNIAATRGQPVFLVDGTEVRLEHIDAAYTLKAADIASLGEPAKGDRIVDGGETYEVLAPPGAKCYEYADPDGTWFAVYAKRVHS